MTAPLNFPRALDESEPYRQRLRLLANKYLGDKEAINLSKMELIEVFVKMGYERDVWKQTAMSFECQLYMADPGNDAFKDYPQEKLDAMTKTVMRWKQEIEAAKNKADNSIPQKENIS